jgi:hypothetical protein
VGCGFETRRSVPFTAPATIVGLADRHPLAAMTVAVPGTIIGFAVVAAHPLVFVPLLVLVGVALVASALYEENRRDPICYRPDCPDKRWKAQVHPPKSP